MSLMNEPEERKYASLSPLSVQVCAESIGMEDISDNVMHALAEDATYRLREVVSCSCTFMRLARRKRLKDSDVVKAFLQRNIPAVKGSTSELEFVAAGDVVCSADETLNLEDVGKDVVTPCAKKAITLSSELLNSQNDQVNEDPETNTSLNDPCTSYYSAVVECILGDKEQLFLEIIKDLRSNGRISPTLPYFANFLTHINLVSHDLDKLSWMLFTVKALFSNKLICLDHYLMPLLKSVMYCVMEPLAASINPLNDHWVLRDYGARLVAEIKYKYQLVDNSSTQHVHSLTREILSDPSRPLCTHYGALMTVAELGPQDINRLFLPIFQQYLKEVLTPVLSPEESDHVKEDAQKVVGAIRLCFYRLIALALAEDDGRGDAFDPWNPAVFAQARELFGDSLQFPECHILTCRNSQDPTLPNKASSNRAWRFVRLPRMQVSGRKAAVGDVFDVSEHPADFERKPIVIRFGRPRTVTQRFQIRKPNDFSFAQLQSTLLGNVKRSFTPPQDINCSLQSWL